MKNKILALFFIATLFGGITINVSAKAAVKRTDINSLSDRTDALEDQIHALKNQIDQAMRKKGTKFISFGDSDVASLVELYAHGPAVVASPSFGFRGPDSHELMVNLTTINRDLYLLELRQKVERYAVQNGIPVPHSPIIALSGGVEGHIEYKDNYNYSRNSKTEMELSHAELFVVGEATPWATGSIIFAYDEDDTFSSGKNTSKAKNSRIYLDRGWLTFGQLEKCPIYFSIGQLYAPFGRYSSYMVTSPSTKHLGRVKDHLIVLGYDLDEFDAQIYGFEGETRKSGDEGIGTKIVRHGGFNFGYSHKFDNVKISFGGGVLGNLAESQRMQEIFGERDNKSAEILNSSIPAYNGRVKFDIYDFDLLAEYIGAAKKFDVADLAFNGYGARPWALDIEAAYSFKIKGKQNTAFVGYTQTGQALGLGLPKQTFFAGYNFALVKNVITGIEYRHDVNYGWHDRAGSTGRDVKAASVTGRQKNTVTLMMGVYF